MLYVGLDYHLRTSSLCILNEDGKLVKQQTVRGRFPEVVEELARLQEPLEVVFEATGGYAPLHERLSKLGMARRVVMAHPAATAPPDESGWGTSPARARRRCGDCWWRRRGSRSAAAKRCDNASSRPAAGIRTGARSPSWRWPGTSRR